MKYAGKSIYFFGLKSLNLQCFVILTHERPWMSARLALCLQPTDPSRCGDAREAKSPSVASLYYHGRCPRFALGRIVVNIAAACKVDSSCCSAGSLANPEMSGVHMLFDLVTCHLCDPSSTAFVVVTVVGLLLCYFLLFF